MSDGAYERISDIRVGNYVVAVDPATGERTAKPVLDISVGQGTKHLIDIDLVGNADTHLTATAEHPFRVVGAGWINAKNVRAGDRLLTDRGAAITARSVHDRGAVAGHTVYNLNIGDIHTFSVAVDGQTRSCAHA